jgi:peptide/nickel transport system substrate-binding protein
MGSRDRVEEFRSLMANAPSFRIGRRSLLKVIGASASVTAFAGLLAACGQDADDDAPAVDTDDDDVVEDTDDSDDEPEVADDEEVEEVEIDEDEESPSERGGGTYAMALPEDPAGLDFHASSGQSQSEWSSFSFSRLFNIVAGPDFPDGSLDTEPDAAETLDVSEDGLTYTITLRDNVMFHPPLSRTMTSEDVVFSFNYLGGEVGIQGQEPEISSRFDRLNIVDSIEAPDDLTVEFTLSEPHPFFPSTLADNKVLFIHPVEVQDEYNPAEQLIGSGPWILEDYRPNSGATYRRHADWHRGPDLPYMDGMEVSIIPEYSTRMSQFMGGNLDWLRVEGADLPRVEEEVPDAQIHLIPHFPLSVLNFSPREEHWQDERLRRAVSMAMNRDEMLDAAYGLTQMEDAGIEVERQWHTWIPIGMSEFWLDPKTEMDPDSAQYLEYNPDLARELVEEAGGGFQTELHYTTGVYGEPYRIMAELAALYISDIGLECVLVEDDYNSVFIPEVAQGEFDGMMFITQTRVDPFAYFQTQYLNFNHGLYGQWSQDEEILDRLEHIRSIVDFDELRDEILDLQNLLAQRMYVVPMQDGAGPTYHAYQARVGGALDYQTFADEEATHFYWIED